MEHWSIKVTDENWSAISNYFTKKIGTDYYTLSKKQGFVNFFLNSHNNRKQTPSFNVERTFLSQLPRYTEITIEQFKQISGEMNEQKISRKDLLSLRDISKCPEWKLNIEKYLLKSVFQKEDFLLVIDPKDLEYLQKTGTVEQILAVEYLGVKLEDKNLFKNFITSAEEEVLMKAFKKITVDQHSRINLLDSGTPDDKPELRRKGLWVSSEYKVETGQAKNGGTYISIFKK